MSNPYQAPIQGGTGRPNLKQEVSNSIQGPAISLIVVSAIALVLGLLGLVADVLFIATGFVDQLEQVNDGPISEYTQITIRAIWGSVLVIASSFVLYGAISMRNMKNYSLARSAAIVAVIPLIGPCCVLGIPFGIWALVALGKPGVQEAFSS
jgi:hypothetical protein